MSENNTWLTWLKLLPIDIDLQSITMPTIPVQDNDKIIGTLPEDLQKLYSLGRSYTRKCDEINIKLDYEMYSKEDENLSTRYDLLSKALSSIFWYAVREQYNLWTDDIGIREGFRVVVTP